MAAKNNVILVELTDPDGAALTGSISPIGFRDIDETQAWIEGTHLGSGIWQFNLPTGIPSGWKIGVQTAAGVFTEDALLSGSRSAAEIGIMLSSTASIT
jgi:hypothetical protein